VQWQREAGEGERPAGVEAGAAGEAERAERELQCREEKVMRGSEYEVRKPATCRGAEPGVYR
jgi:hypothetical protein